MGAPRSPQHRLEFPVDFGVDFDPEAFDQAIANKGVPFTHWRAFPCPIGRTSSFDYRHPHDHPPGCGFTCSQGFLYQPAGVVRALYTGNSVHMLQMDLGLLTGSSVMVSMARTYDCEPGQEPRQALIAAFDRLFVPDPALVVVTTELFEVSGAPTDRVRFPIVSVVDLIDTRGNEYRTGVDFDISDGRIKWLTQRRPSYNPQLNSGDTCSIRYTYRPYYYVKELVHEVRVGVVEALDGSSAIVRLPQSAILQRENVFEDESRNEAQAKHPSAREAQSPGRLGLGPR